MRRFQWYRPRCDSTKTHGATPKYGNGGGKDGGARVFEFWCYCIVLYTIGTGSMRRFQWYRPRCDSTKTHGATPKYGNGGGKDGGARVFEFWCYCIVLYSIGTGSMRRFQWYRPRCDSTKTHGATPKYGNGGGEGSGARV
jgi:hypothetical protein